MISAPIPLELVEELERAFPESCLRPMDNVNRAYWYAGKVDLIKYLRSCYEKKKEFDLTESVTGLPVSKGDD